MAFEGESLIRKAGYDDKGKVNIEVQPLKGQTTSTSSFIPRLRLSSRAGCASKGILVYRVDGDHRQQARVLQDGGPDRPHFPDSLFQNRQRGGSSTNETVGRTGSNWQAATGCLLQISFMP